MINLSERLREIVQDELDPQHFATVQAKVYESMEYIVGRRIAALLSDRQLGEFEVILDAEDKSAGTAYLEAHVPAYHAVVAQVLDEHLAVVAAAYHIGLLGLR